MQEPSVKDSQGTSKERSRKSCPTRYQKILQSDSY